MAKTALGIEHDEPTKYSINWNSTATIDYFGSPSENFPYREHILRTLALASGAYTGGENGGDDISDRTIKMTCDDPRDRCRVASIAYTYNGLDQEHPLINYCPGFFQYLRSHSEMWHRMRDGPAPADAWHNVRNLRSQATTALHKLLHINSSWAANACAAGCADTLQALDGGRELVWTYRAGPAKLLARRDARSAAQTADNYVYYAAARWMELKDARQHPLYPVAWNPAESRQWNQDGEGGEPGAPLPGMAALYLDDLDVGDDERPDVYAPVLDSME